MRRLGLGLGLTRTSSKESGEAVLAAGTSWVDADTGLTTVDITTPALRSGWGIIFSGNRAAVTNQDGPAGEPGIRLTENATTANGIFGPLSAISNLSIGPIKVTTLCRTFDNATQRLPGGTYSTSNPSSYERWRFPDLAANGAGFGAYIRAIEPTHFQTPAVLGDPGVAYAFTGISRYDSYSRVDRPDGWSEVTWEGYIANKASLAGVGQSIRASSSSMAGNSQIVLDIATLTIEQKRVSEWRDRRTNSVVYSQATNNSRLCKQDDYWLGSRPCVTEGISIATGNVSITAAATPVVLMAMVAVRITVPDADSQVLAIGDTKLMADTDGKWHLVQGVTDLDTGYPVSPMPICVCLRNNGTSVDLFIDGELIYTGAITLTGSGHAFGGGHSGAVVQSIWTKSALLTDEQVSLGMIELRRLSGLEGPIPIWIETGQSNMNVGLPLQASLYSGAKRRAGWGMRLEGGDPVGQAQYTTHSTHYYGGHCVGVFNAAQALGHIGIVYHYNLGGMPISHWLEGGDGQLAISAGIADLVASVGTPLVRVEKFFFVQGEADASFSTPEATYLAGLENILGWLSADYGSQVRFHALRLTTAYPVGTPAPIRAAQDAFEAAHPERVFYEAVDPSYLTGDDVHYTEEGKVVIGHTLFEADQ